MKITDPLKGFPDHGPLIERVLTPAYDELTERFRFMEAVELGLADVEAGRVTPHEEVVAKMRRRFGGSADE